MQLRTEESNGAMKGTIPRPTSAANSDEDDTDDERGVTPTFGTGGLRSYARRRATTPATYEYN